MTETRRPRGRFFEEMTVGDVSESVGRTVTETDIVLFAGLTGDNNPLHTNAVYAEATSFGQRIAHGLLGLSFAGGLAWQSGALEETVEALIGVDWKFRAPVFIGDTIRTKTEITKKREMRRLGGGFVTFAAALVNQRDEVTQKGTLTVLVRSRPETQE